MAFKIKVSKVFIEDGFWSKRCITASPVRYHVEFSIGIQIGSSKFGKSISWECLDQFKTRSGVFIEVGEILIQIIITLACDNNIQQTIVVGIYKSYVA